MTKEDVKTIAITSAIAAAAGAVASAAVTLVIQKLMEKKKGVVTLTPVQTIQPAPFIPAPAPISPSLSPPSTAGFGAELGPYRALR